MKDKTIQDILDMSQTFSSGKRLLLMFILKRGPMGYTSIVKSFEDLGVPIGSSEVYKHLEQLMKGGFVSKNTKSYILTLKGFKAVENTIDIIDAPATVPELKLTFKKSR